MCADIHKHTNFHTRRGGKYYGIPGFITQADVKLLSPISKNTLNKRYIVTEKVNESSPTASSSAILPFLKCNCALLLHQKTDIFYF